MDKLEMKVKVKEVGSRSFRLKLKLCSPSTNFFCKCQIKHLEKVILLKLYEVEYQHHKFLIFTKSVIQNAI